MEYSLKGKRILVTGATGFIGGHVAKRLLHDGIQVRVMARDLEKAKFLADRGAEVVCGDMTDLASLKSAVQGCQVVLHLAAAVRKLNIYSTLAYMRAVNVEGPRALAEYALEAKVERFVHTSSSWVFGLDAAANTGEDALRHPSHEPYSDTKLEGENVIRTMIKQLGLPAVIVYPSIVFGPYDDAWTMGVINAIQEKRMMLPSGGTGLLHPIFIDDLVEGLLAAATRGNIGEGYILCGPETVTVREYGGYLARMIGQEKLPSIPSWLALSIATLAEWEANIFHHRPWLMREAVRGMAMHTTYNGEKSKRELGFEAHTPVMMGMERVQDWLLHTGRMPD